MNTARRFLSTCTFVTLLNVKSQVRKVRRKLDRTLWLLNTNRLAYFALVWTVANGAAVPIGVIRWTVGGSSVPPLALATWLVSTVVSIALWRKKSPNSHRYQWSAKPIPQFNEAIARTPFPNAFERPVLCGNELNGVNPDFDLYLCNSLPGDRPLLGVGAEHGRYRFPTEMQQYSRFIFDHVVGRQKDQFNDAKVGLKATLIPGHYGSGYSLLKSDFFSTRCTNNAVNLQIVDTTGGTQHVVFNGLRDLATTNGMWRDLDGTLSHEIGVSTLMFARRSRKVVLTVQAAGNHRNAGNDVPTGSGGVDWSDVEDSGCLSTGRLEDLIVYAAERELLEECGFPKGTRMWSKIIGFRRDMNRGGKPEFLLVTVVDDDESIRTHSKRSEKQYVSGHHPIPLPVLPDRDEALKINVSEIVACLKHEIRGGDTARSKADQLRYHYMLLLRLLTGTWSPRVLVSPISAFELDDVPDQPAANEVTSFLERVLNP